MEVTNGEYYTDVKILKKAADEKIEREANSSEGIFLTILPIWHKITNEVTYKWI